MSIERIGEIRSKIQGLRDRFNETRARFENFDPMKKAKGGETQPSPRVRKPSFATIFQEESPPPGPRTERSSPGQEAVALTTTLATLAAGTTASPPSPANSPLLNEQGALDKAAVARTIDALAQRHGVNPQLVRAVIQVESAFQPRAVSSKGAMGLMQLMPGTAADLGVSDPFNPEENIDGGTRLLSRLMKKYDQDLDLALSAYNAGEANVDRHQGIPPFRETRDYVGKVKKELGLE